MKEIIIIILILIIIIGGGIFVQQYLKNSSEEIISELYKLRDLIESNQDINIIKEKSNGIYSKWKETEKTWSIIVLHSELDLIETTLIEMKSLINEEDIEKSKAQLEKSIFLVNHINEKEKFSIKNIF